MTPKISLWPQHISPNYLGKSRHSNLDICTQKRISWQKGAINLSRGNGAPTTRLGDRQRRQGTALLGSRRRPPSSQSDPALPSLAVDKVGHLAEGGQRLGFRTGPSRPRGRGKTRRWRLSVQPRQQQRIRGLFPWSPRPAALSQPVRPSPGRSSDSSSKMRPPTPPAPSVLSPAATDRVAIRRLPAPEMRDYGPEPWTQSRFRLRLRLPPEPQPQPRRWRRRLPFRPPSSHGPAARRQPSHVTQTWPRPRPTARADALRGDSGARWIPSLELWTLLPSAASSTGSLATAWQQLTRSSCPLPSFHYFWSYGVTEMGHTCRHNLSMKE